VIAEGFQLLYDKRVVDILDHMFLLEIGSEECIRRRSAQRGPHNGNPLSLWKCENLLWPAHERYLESSVAPLGDKVQRIPGPSSAEDVAAIAKSIVEATGL